MRGQRSLNNFYQSVVFRSPSLALEMRNNVEIVALGGLSSEPSEEAKQAAQRLRSQTLELPVVFQRVLENALEDLGYDLA